MQTDTGKTGYEPVHSFREPYLQQLADATKETVCLCIRDQTDAIYVDKLDSPMSIRFIIDAYWRFPLYATSGVILAYSPETLQETVLSEPITAFTNHSITDPEQLRLRLEEIRNLGYEISSNMRDIEVTGIAAPIFQNDGNVLASVSLIGSSERMELHVDRWLALLLQMTQEMPRLNGFL